MFFFSVFSFPPARPAGGCNSTPSLLSLTRRFRDVSSRLTLTGTILPFLLNIGSSSKSKVGPSRTSLRCSSGLLLHRTGSCNMKNAFRPRALVQCVCVVLLCRELSLPFDRRILLKLWKEKTPFGFFFDSALLPRSPCVYRMVRHLHKSRHSRPTLLRVGYSLSLSLYLAPSYSDVFSFLVSLSLPLTFPLPLSLSLCLAFW